MCTPVISVDKHLSRLRSPRVSEGIMAEQRAPSTSVCFQESFNFNLYSSHVYVLFAVSHRINQSINQFNNQSPSKMSLHFYSQLLLES